jgi:hypothetical protein
MKTDRKTRLMRDVEHTSEKREPQASFDDLLINSVDEAVSEILGPRITSMFWRHFQAYLGITREEMPSHISQLIRSLQEIFGTGGQTVGEIVIRKLYQKAGVSLNFSRNHPLAEYAEELKQILAKDENR